MLPLALLVLGLPQAPVDVSLLPSAQSLPGGCTVAIDLIVSSVPGSTLSAVDALLEWDPAQLGLIQAVPSNAGWFVAAFLADPDGINSDVTDGQALFTALANPAQGLYVQGDVTVATIYFQALHDGQVALAASAGVFAKTRVIGTLPGEELTGLLSPPAQVDTFDVFSQEIPVLGMPPNPNALLPGATSGPVIGQPWDPRVDHSSFFPTALVDLLAITAFPAPFDLPSQYGTFLIDLNQPYLLFAKPAGTPFDFVVNNNCSLVGKSAYAQAASLDFIDVFLTNRLDLLIGNQ